MHFCLNLFTKKMPTEEEIEKILNPYSEMENSGIYPQYISWDWYEIGGRYKNLIETKSGLFVDGAYFHDIKNIEQLGCYAFINADGVAFSRDIWDGKQYLHDDRFVEKYYGMILYAITNDYYLTIVDIHE